MNAAVDQTLAALADPARRAMVSLLSRGPRLPSEIAEELRASRPTVSRHLRVLRRAGLVSESIQAGDARQRLYTLHQAPFATLREWIQEVEVFWHDQLHAFKAHAERSHAGPGDDT